jgi:hypothetical protein
MGLYTAITWTWLFTVFYHVDYFPFSVVGNDFTGTSVDQGIVGKPIPYGGRIE